MTTSPSPDTDWKRSLAAFAGRRLAVVGIGRRDAGDDGLGPLVIALLAGRASLSLFDAQTAPENFVAPIARANPDLILLVDAVAFAAPPGHIRLFEPSALDETDFTTHAMSPRLLLDFLARRTGARTLVLAVQPVSSALGSPMTPPVRAAAHAIADALASLFPA